MNILSIETSTKVCSVAIHKEGELVALKESFVPNSHSELINVFVKEVLEKALIEKGELNAVCISEGPGSYTGLRIGTSTAKGLCYALDIPLLSIKTLHGMALSATELEEVVDLKNKEDVILCPMIDARRMEVYCATFDSNGKEITETEAKIIDEDSFKETLMTKKMLFFGDGASKCKEVIKSDNAIFLEDVNPTAKSFGYYAKEKLAANKIEDVAYFEPFYLKAFHTVPSKKNVLFGMKK